MGESSAEPELIAGLDPDESQGRVRRRLVGWRLPSWMRAGASAWIWLGVSVVAAGFVLIAVAWGQVAAQTQVFLQLPYVVSAGLVGLGLIMVGLTILNIASWQRDVIDRDHQIDQLISIMEELKQTLIDQRGRRKK